MFTPYVMKPVFGLRYCLLLLTCLLWNCKSDDPAPTPFQATDFEVVINTTTQSGNDYRVNYDIVNKTTRRYAAPSDQLFNVVFTAKAADGSTYTEQEGVPELDASSRQARVTLVSTTGKQTTITAEVLKAP